MLFHDAQCHRMPHTSPPPTHHDLSSKHAPGYAVVLLYGCAIAIVPLRLTNARLRVDSEC